MSTWEIVLAAATPVFLYILGYYLIPKAKEIKQNNADKQSSFLNYLLSGLIKAADQVFKSADGKEKKDYVKKGIKEAFAKFGWKWDDQWESYIDKLIEGLVNEKKEKSLQINSGLGLLQLNEIPLQSLAMLKDDILKRLPFKEDVIKAVKEQVEADKKKAANK